MRGVVFLTMMMAVALTSVTAQAGDWVHEMKMGVLDHDTPGLWSGFNRESGVDTNLEVILSSQAPLWGGAVRPAFGVSVNAVGDTSKAYGAARWERDLSASTFVALGIGAAVHNGETKWVNAKKKVLGSRVLFYFPIEAGFRIDESRSISLFFDHVSNAWLADSNEGMDTLGVRFGYKF